MKKISALLIILSFFVFGISSYAANMPENPPMTLKNRVVTVPAGNVFKGVFLAPISSETAYTGQEVMIALGTDFYYGDKLIAPAGSTVTGTVIEVARAKHGSLDGKLTMRFTHILTPSGNNIPISAVIKTEDNSGVIYGNRKWDYITDYERSLNGEDTSLSIRSLSPVRVNTVLRGNNTMPALGGGGGLVKSIWDKGSDVSIPVNTSIDLILLQPITLNSLAVEN